MPIEIRELIIKTQITADNQENTAPAASSGDTKKDEQIIGESVEQVLDILQRKEER